MKKIILSLGLVGTFIIYAFTLKNHNNEENNRVVTVDSGATTQTTIPDTVTPTTDMSTSMPTMSSKYKNGTYTGDSSNAYYGYVQVKVVISGGQITDVVFLNYPQDRNTSRSINTQAMPILKQEVIQAQSADISGVSGASATSPAFIQSVASALNQAAI